VGTLVPETVASRWRLPVYGPRVYRNTTVRSNTDPYIDQTPETNVDHGASSV